MAPIEFNEDELVAPDWLNNELITKILQSCEDDTAITVQMVKFTPGTAKGDHYASIMFRATIEYESKKGAQQTRSIIIKTMPEYDTLKSDMLKESFIFETEIAMYTEVIPRFESMLREVGDDTVLSARCLYHSLEPKKIIVFEDICPLGFAVLRERAPNMEELKAALGKLAKWHALSYKINIEEPNYFDKFSHSFMTLPDLEFLSDGMPNFTEMLANTPSLIKYKPYFDAMQPDLIEKVKATFEEFRLKPQENGLYVLCHGDFHFKNLMFKHDQVSGQLQDLMLLDFQLSYVGPMTNDLVYAIYMMMNNETRRDLDEYLQYYFSQFQETLRRTDFSGRIPKLIEFRQQLLRHKHCDIFLLVTFMPMMYAFSRGTADPEKIMSDPNYRKLLYYEKEYCDDLHDILPRYFNLGYLDN